MTDPIDVLGSKVLLLSDTNTPMAEGVYLVEFRPGEFEQVVGVVDARYCDDADFTCHFCLRGECQLHYTTQWACAHLKFRKAID